MQNQWDPPESDAKSIGSLRIPPKIDGIRRDPAQNQWNPIQHQWDP